MAGLTAFAAAAAPAVGAAVGVYSVVEQQRARKTAASAAERAAALRQQELELKEKQAGEYFEISGRQMELQAQAGQISTLANLIEKAKEPAGPKIFTLPPAKEYSALERINMAIGDLLLRAG